MSHCGLEVWLRALQWTAIHGRRFSDNILVRRGCKSDVLFDRQQRLWRQCAAQNPARVIMLPACSLHPQAYAAMPTTHTGLEQEVLGLAARQADAIEGRGPVPVRRRVPAGAPSVLVVARHQVRRLLDLQLRTGWLGLGLGLGLR